MIGKGKVNINDGKVSYTGTFPQIKDGDLIVILMLDDLEKIIRADELALLVKPYEMPKQLFCQTVIDEDKVLEAQIPDEIAYIHSNNKQTKLFLDRHLYSSCPEEMIWIRYVSVNQSLMEEN